MFKGSLSTNFKTDQSKEKVYENIQDQLESLGSVELSDRGIIKINASKFSGFAHDCVIEGKIRERENKYTVELEWEANPNWGLVIIVSLCLFGLGLVLLIFPYMANADIQKRAASVLDNIRYDFK